MLIYKVTNSINGKIYIGKTEMSMEKRYACYKSDAKSGRHDKNYFFRAIREHGLDNFLFEIVIDNIGTVAELNYAERYMIAYTGSNNKLIGYNSTDGGDGVKMFGANNPNYGKKKPHLSELNKSRTGIALSQVHRDKIGNRCRGRKHSEDTIKKIKSIKRTQEQKDNISNKNRKEIYCDGIKFDSVGELAKHLNVGMPAISNAIKRNNKVSGRIVSLHRGTDYKLLARA